MRSRGLLVAVVVIPLACILEIDARTGSAPFQHLYYVPIVIAAIGLPPYGGVVAALVYAAKNAGRNHVSLGVL